MKKKSLLIFPAVALAASFFIIMLDRSDWSYVFTIQFAMDMVITSACVWLVLFYIYRVSRWLDATHPWEKDAFTRLAYQTFFGLFIPCILTLVLTWLQYEFIYHQSMIETGFIFTEFPFIILLLAITNLVFFIIYIVQRKQAPAPIATSTLFAKRGKKNISVPVDRIALITIDPTIRIITLENEHYFLAENLDHYEKELPETDFFRVNRQTLIARKACHSFQSIENGKISVGLSVDHQAPVIVSQKRAARFRAWMKENGSTSA